MKKLDVCNYSNVFGKKANSVDKNISLAHKSYDSTKNAVQVAAVSVLHHAYQHGDYSKAQVLIDGLVGLNQAALVEYFVKFGGLIVDEEGNGFSGWKGKDFIRDNMADARQKPWYELKKQSPYKGFDLHDELLKLLKKANAANKRLDAAIKQGDDETANKIAFVDEKAREDLATLANSLVENAA